VENGKLFKQVLRYDLIWYDAHWNELPLMRRNGLRWAQVFVMLKTWNAANESFMASGDVFPVGSAEANYVSIEVTYGEEEASVGSGPIVPTGRGKRSSRRRNDDGEGTNPPGMPTP